MKKNTLVKRTLDIILAILLLFLMAYQVIGDLWHEWLGIAMTVLVIVHHILNRRWYTALFKGKYTAYRTAITVVDCLLLISFALAALTGISMSAYAVPFLNGLIPMMTAMKLHLGVSWWSFVLMSIHIGLHLRPVFAGLKVSERTRLIIKIFFAILGAAGIILLFFEDIPKYLAFRTHFATHLIGGPTILKNILMMFPWVTFGIYGYNWRKNDRT